MFKKRKGIVHNTLIVASKYSTRKKNKEETNKVNTRKGDHDSNIRGGGDNPHLF